MALNGFTAKHKQRKPKAEGRLAEYTSAMKLRSCLHSQQCHDMAQSEAMIPSLSLPWPGPKPKHFPDEKFPPASEQFVVFLLATKPEMKASLQSLADCFPNRGERLFRGSDLDGTMW